MDLNKVILVGRMTADPQLRTTPGGQSVTTIGVATGRVWNDKNGQRQEETEFHNVVLWGRQAEIAGQYLKKGAMVLIEGRLRTRSWTDKNGQQRRTTEIMAERLQLGPRPQGSGGQGGGSWQGGGAAGAGNPAAAGGFAPRNAAAGPGPQSGTDKLAEEEIPVISLDEEEIKPEEIPF
ncbi:MAG TPA: single-stranded DNA-binding protein [Candidatus Paceibacterota bacterium]|nr:single-stranded DNA-binding protein [Candidatus Paceibacterota bacterium]